MMLGVIDGWYQDGHCLDRSNKNPQSLVKLASEVESAAALRAGTVSMTCTHQYCSGHS